MMWFLRSCRVWWCLLSLFALSHPVHAASEVDVASADQMDIIETREVVVSATKTPIPVTHLTSAVEVITEEDLTRRQVKTVVDALRLSQGLTVFSNGGPGTSTTVRIRGSNADQVLVLIDGVIMNSATLGSYNFAGSSSRRVGDFRLISDWIEHASEDLEAQILLVA